MTDIIDSTTFNANTASMLNSPSTDARFWQRAYATLVDGIIISLLSIPFVVFFVPFFMYNYDSFHRFCLMSQNIVGGPLSINIILVSSGLYLLLTQIITVIYFCYCLSSRDQATPGMKIHSLKLVDNQGNRPLFAKIFLRETISIISFWGFFIGYLMVLFTERRQALHDMATSTYVQDNSDESNTEILISQRYQNYNYSGFWCRLGALIVDNIIYMGFSFCILIILGSGHHHDHSGDLLTYLMNIANNNQYSLISNLLFNVLPIFYWTFFTASKFQATPGKILFSLKVIDNYGNRLTIFKSFIRYFSYIYSMIIFFIGFIMPAFTQRKQGFHDKIAQTYVIRVLKKSKDNNV